MKLVERILAFSFAVAWLGGQGVALATVEPCIWKTTDIMDHRIDIGAQRSLMRQMSEGPPESREASAMIGAVKEGTLAGILLPPRQAVAERAQRLEPPKNYGDLLSGRNSICLREPAGEPPMIVYRQNLEPEQIDEALHTAWAECDLPTPEPPCLYVVDAWAPRKECTDDNECTLKGLGWVCSDSGCVECETDQHCIDQSLGNVCMEDKRCAYELEPIKVTPTPKPRPNPTCWYDANCPNGWTCNNGYCIPPDSPEHRCFERIHKEWRSGVEKCEDAQFPKLVECGIDAAKCSAGSADSCISSVKCMHDSHAEKEECKKKHFREFEEKKKECYAPGTS
jgi:hypothetical protein